MIDSISLSRRARPTRIAIVLDASGSAYRDVLNGVLLYAKKRRDWLIYVEEAPWSLIPHLTPADVDGVVACIRSADLGRVLQMLPVPVAYIQMECIGKTDNGSPLDVCRVMGDDAAIGRLGCDFLIDHACLRLAFAGIATADNSGSLQARAAGFEQRAAERRVSCAVHIADCRLPRQWTKALSGLDEWLQSLKKPVGLMAYNDMHAAQIVQLCGIRGLAIPEQVAVLGVGNDPVFCELPQPSLSSIDHSIRALAYRAAGLLDGLMAGRSALKKEYRVAPLGVVARCSTNGGQVIDEDVAAARNYITEHFSEPIQVGDVVNAVQVSRATLKRKFNAIVGRSISEEIQRVRIERAKHLLTSTEIKLDAIARQIGLRSQEHLSTLFQKTLGMTPTAFREQMEDNVRIVAHIVRQPLNW